MYNNKLFENILYGIQYAIKNALYENEKNIKQKIICAFPALGKSYFIKTHNNAVDYDRCYFQFEREDDNRFNPTQDNVIYKEEPQIINGKKIIGYKKDLSFPNNFIETIEETPNNIKYILCAVNDDIIDALEKRGFKNVQKIGRGENITFSCEYPDNTNEQEYYILRDILIDEFGYSKSFNYSDVLNIIDFYINNKEYITLDDIVESIGNKISISTLSRHRYKLSKMMKNFQN